MLARGYMFCGWFLCCVWEWFPRVLLQEGLLTAQWAVLRAYIDTRRNGYPHCFVTVDVT